jgi:hypothetical protein
MCANTLNEGWLAKAVRINRCEPGRANALAQSHHLSFRREPGSPPGATARSASSNGRPLRVGRGAGSNPGSASCRSNPPPLLHRKPDTARAHLVRTNAHAFSVEAVRLGKGCPGVITWRKVGTTCDPRICHPRRAPDMRDDSIESIGSLPSPREKGERRDDSQHVVRPGETRHRKVS